MRAAPLTLPGSRAEMNAPAAFATATSPLRDKPVSRHRPLAGGSRRNSLSAMLAGSNLCSIPRGTRLTVGRLVMTSRVLNASVALIGAAPPRCERLLMFARGRFVAAVDDLCVCIGVFICSDTRKGEGQPIPENGFFNIRTGEQTPPLFFPAFVSCPLSPQGGNRNTKFSSQALIFVPLQGRVPYFLLFLSHRHLFLCRLT